MHNIQLLQHPTQTQASLKESTTERYLHANRCMGATHSVKFSADSDPGPTSLPLGLLHTILKTKVPLYRNRPVHVRDPSLREPGSLDSDALM